MPQGMLQLQVPVYTPHSPIENPSLTEESQLLIGSLEDVLRKGECRPGDKMRVVEKKLLDLWEFRDRWTDYLDAPLLAHAYAALKLGEKFDAVVGIKAAGIPYASFFQRMDFPFYSLDFSHHKRKMKEPVLNSDSLSYLKEHKNVLLVDIDLVTGRTLKTVSEYLTNLGVKVGGAYLGLSRWPGMELEEPHLGIENTSFRALWKSCGLMRYMNTRLVEKKGITLPLLEISGPNPQIGVSEKLGSLAAREVAAYLLGRKSIP